MSSENFTLPHFADLCETFNVPPPSRRRGDVVQPNVPGPITPLYTSPPVINFGPDGYHVIQGPLNHDQQGMLQSQFSIPDAMLKNISPKNHYAVPKMHGPTSHGEPVRSSDKCYVPFTRQPGGNCFMLQLQRPFFDSEQRSIRPRTEARGNNFVVYLHRPQGDQRSTIPFRGSIPFISTDAMDRALGLPGVSISRLFSEEPGILVNANGIFSFPHPTKILAAYRVEIAAAGCNEVVKNTFLVECAHSRITRLGLARHLAHGLVYLLTQTPEPRHLNASNVRLVALYKLEGTEDDVWNVAYAVVNP
ncbi:hypothetical protein IW262DRAFT_1486467 [Armillaria fumosa]|nr:hypothetical protein IW262DRAFT_1486467 [Armillaria fumosa]